MITSWQYSYWKSPSHVYQPADLMVAPDQLDDFTNIMDATDMKYETYISDVQQLIDHENPVTLKKGFDWTSYHTLDEIYAWMESLVEQYPGKVRRIPISPFIAQ